MRFILTFIIFSLFAKQECQSQTVPLDVNIKLQKSYVLNYPKKHFDYYLDRSNFRITTDSVAEKQFDVEITIQNTSSQEIQFWMMSCSWWDNFLVNNNYMFLKVDECFKNVPTLIKLKPRESKKYLTTLTKSIKFDYPCENCIFGRQVEETKLGLIIINDVLSKDYGDYRLLMGDKSKWKILWSNAL
jgi:hypothetical protein